MTKQDMGMIEEDEVEKDNEDVEKVSEKDSEVKV